MIESYFSIQIESAGPIPGEYSLLTLGACFIKNPTQSFYLQLKPINDNYISEYITSSGLSWGELRLNGEEPQIGFERFQSWINKYSSDTSPVFVALNSSVPWMFVHYYFMKYCQTNPFGFNGLDLRSYAMGKLKNRWYQTQYKQVSKKSFDSPQVIEKALYQAQLFQMLFEVD